MVPALFSIFAYVMIRLEAINCMEYGSATTVVSDDRHKWFCSAAYLTYNTLNGYIYDQTIDWDGNVVEGTNVLNERIKLRFQNSCEADFEKRMPNSRLNGSVDDITEFVHYWCSPKKNPNTCLDDAETFVITLGYDFRSAGTICKEFISINRTECLVELITLMSQFKITHDKWIVSKDDTVNCMKCVKHISNCNDETREMLKNLSTRIDNLGFQVYNVCDAIWTDNLLQKYKGNERNDAVFSLLLKTPRRNLDNNVCICNEKDYENIVPYLLETKRKDPYEYFMKRAFLGTLCYEHNPETQNGIPHHLLSYPLDLIENVLDVYGFEEGLETLTKATRLKVSPELFSVLHTTNVSNRDGTKIRKSMGIELHLPAVMDVLGKGASAILKIENRLQTYYENYVIPIVKALDEFYTDGKVDKAEH